MLPIKFALCACVKLIATVAKCDTKVRQKSWEAIYIPAGLGQTKEKNIEKGTAKQCETPVENVRVRVNHLKTEVGQHVFWLKTSLHNPKTHSRKLLRRGKTISMRLWTSTSSITVQKKASLDFWKINPLYIMLFDCVDHPFNFSLPWKAFLNFFEHCCNMCFINICLTVFCYPNLHSVKYMEL